LVEQDRRCMLATSLGVRHHVGAKYHATRVRPITHNGKEMALSSKHKLHPTGGRGPYGGRTARIEPQSLAAFRRPGPSKNRLRVSVCDE
jgi:hypothetical protein